MKKQKKHAQTHAIPYRKPEGEISCRCDAITQAFAFSLLLTRFDEKKIIIDKRDKDRCKHTSPNTSKTIVKCFFFLIVLLLYGYPRILFVYVLHQARGSNTLKTLERMNMIHEKNDDTTTMTICILFLLFFVFYFFWNCVVANI